MHSKWSTGALGGDNCIYGSPCAAASRRLIRVDPVAKTASLFGPDLHRLVDHEWNGWLGLTTGIDGCLYGTPAFANRPLIIDPFAGSFSFGEVIPTECQDRLCFGVCDKDGD